MGLRCLLCLLGWLGLLVLLVKVAGLCYYRGMLRKCCLFSALVFCGMQTVPADTIQLREKAAITGKILSEKRDQIAVDVGYTVLVIPRNQVAKILKTDDAELPTKVIAKPAIPVEAKDLIESK